MGVKKRIFIGIKFRGNKKDLRVFRKKYSNLSLRFISDKNLHITLIPPWYEENVSGIVSFLKEIKLPSSFNVRLAKVELAPNKRKPHLIWAQGKAPKKLLHLKKIIEQKLNKFNFKREFKLHLTLARFKTRDFKKFPIKKIEEKINWNFKVSSFILYESILGKNGSKYRIIEKFKLPD